MTQWSAAILAGGQSRRFGGVKFLSEIGGETLIRRVARAVSPESGDLLVVVGQDEDLAVEQAILREIDGCAPRLVRDTPGPKTIAAGIEAALTAARHDLVAVVAADMPFVSRDLLGLLVERAAGKDAVVPSYRGFHEPACAVYSRGLLPAISAYRRDPAGPVSGRLDAPGVRTARVGEQEIERFGGVQVVFFNVNTREDLAKAREMLASRVPGTSLRGGST